MPLSGCFSKARWVSTIANGATPKPDFSRVPSGFSVGCQWTVMVRRVEAVRDMLTKREQATLMYECAEASPDVTVAVHLILS